MRVNIYNEELTDEVHVVHAEANGQKFVGIRFILKTHEDMLQPNHGNDSAITVWVKVDKIDKLQGIIDEAYTLLDNEAYLAKRGNFVI